jgi:hypothetical protein
MINFAQIPCNEPGCGKYGFTVSIRALSLERKQGGTAGVFRQP